MLSVTAVVPTYNERENISELVRAVHETLAARKHEILVVDDASPDGTADLVRGMVKEVPSVRLVAKENREGIGAALRLGFDQARCDVLVSLDADGSFAPADIPRLLRRVEDGCDLVIGSRHAPGGTYEAPGPAARLKRVVSRLGSAAGRWATGLAVSDYTCHFRALRRTAWRRLALREKSTVLAVEMIVKAARAGLSVDELPVSYRPRLEGVSKRNSIVDAPRFLYKLLYYAFTVPRAPAA